MIIASGGGQMNIFKIGLLALITLLSFSTQAQDAFFDETFGNYQEELEVAADDGKKVFLYFFIWKSARSVTECNQP